MVHAFGLGALAFLLAAFPGWPGAQAACYYPSGRIAPNDIPCRDDTPHAACCGQGYACLSNGICQATGEELQAPGASEFVRGACTDREWRSSSCPLFCIEEDVDFLDGGNGIFKCGDTAEDLYYCINTRTVEETGICEERRDVLFFPGTCAAMALALPDSGTEPDRLQGPRPPSRPSGSRPARLPRQPARLSPRPRHLKSPRPRFPVAATVRVAPRHRYRLVTPTSRPPPLLQI